ncbi:MAG: porphobilinogen synthase, partial [bacterium]|nr:porphobilinogen synthase [bacterium]
MSDRRFLTERPRRLRRTPGVRRLVQETAIRPAGLVLPVFVKEGLTSPLPIASMPGVVQHSESSFRAVVSDAAEAGIGGLMIFGVPDHRDAYGDAACDEASILATAVRWAKDEVGDALPVIADLCLDEFTSHGHCGVLDAHGNVDNDATLAVYERMAVVLADAGSDILGLSGMMDGQVGAVRAALDNADHSDITILAYAAKFASAFYGPFRDAVESQLDGDRR